MAIEIPKSLAELPTTEPRFVGRGMRRVEDAALLTGRVQFIDDLVLPRMLHAAILRSPLAHGRITSVDTSRAEALDGVVAVVTGEDARRWSHPAQSSPDGWGVHCIAGDKVHYVGEPVAAVAASNRRVAEDALELIEVEYDALEPVADPFEAMKSDSPRVLDAQDSNVMMDRIFTWGDVDAAFSQAPHVFREKFRWNRLGANPTETFGCISQWDPMELDLTIHGSIQSPGMFGLGRAASFGLPSNKVNIISQPHGGSLGARAAPGAAILVACFRARRPVVR